MYLKNLNQQSLNEVMPAWMTKVKTDVGEMYDAQMRDLDRQFKKRLDELLSGAQEGSIATQVKLYTLFAVFADRYADIEGLRGDDGIYCAHVDLLYHTIEFYKEGEENCRKQCHYYDVCTIKGTHYDVELL